MQEHGQVLKTDMLIDLTNPRNIALVLLLDTCHFVWILE
jgi:hypothetical protein